MTLFYLYSDQNMHGPETERQRGFYFYGLYGTV